MFSSENSKPAWAQLSWRTPLLLRNEFVKTYVRTLGMAVEWIRAVCARLGVNVLSGSVLCAPGSVEKACYVRPCGVRQARWKSCGCCCGSTDLLADDRKNN